MQPYRPRSTLFRVLSLVQRLLIMLVQPRYIIGQFHERLAPLIGEQIWVLKQYCVIRVKGFSRKKSNQRINSPDWIRN